MRNKISTALGFVAHAAITVLGVIAIQAGVWSIGTILIVYVVGNVTNELLIMKQAEVLDMQQGLLNNTGISEARLNRDLRNELCDMLGLSRAVSNFEIHETVEVCYEHLKASKRVSNN